jgi:tetratricopeptide (TPR) repeat protein
MKSPERTKDDANGKVFKIGFTECQPFTCMTFRKLASNNLQRYDNVRKQGFYQKYIACELLKNEGNVLYNDKKLIRKALECYIHALSIFLVGEGSAELMGSNVRIIGASSQGKMLAKNGTVPLPPTTPGEVNQFYIENEEGKSEKEKTLFRKIKVHIFLNLSLCYLRLEEYENAIMAAHHALVMQPNHAKAL